VDDILATSVPQTPAIVLDNVVATVDNFALELYDASEACLVEACLAELATLLANGCEGPNAMQMMEQGASMIDLGR